ncbi:MAG: hypothetical protein PHC61_12860 [Chitinivibrionales bacterium]|nr:hypothetical protein [Chitinivibrionales bacterium]
MKKILLGLSMIAVLAIPSMGAHLLCGGNVPLINNIVGVGVITLDFSSNGVDQDIATFIVNNNSTSFTCTWTFSNTGNFVNANGVAIPMTTIKMGRQGTDLGDTHMGSGTETLAATDTIFNTSTNSTATELAINGSGTFSTDGIYTTGLLTQTDATVNVPLEMTASWTSGATVLAGLYMESITFGIIAVL